jgi:transcriptional regulator with GAF, ATPase, and Fis domain
MLEWFSSFLSNVERFAVGVSIVSLLMSALSSIIAHSARDIFAVSWQLLKTTISSKAPQRQQTQDSAYKRPVQVPSEVARKRAASRIEEAREAMLQQVSAARWSTISGNMLTVGQYVIGGLLASSFIQESLSPKLVGFLGVLVLLASLIKQHFHPEQSAESARKKAAQLKALIRTSEDQLAILEAKTANGQDHTDALIALLVQITQRLTEIEEPEALESRPQLTA